MNFINWQNKDIKYQPRNKCFCIFTFLPFVAWLTDWYGKQNVEKESIKYKKNDGSGSLSLVILHCNASTVIKQNG